MSAAERSVYVSASPKVSYREVAAAVGAAKAAGAATIGLGRLDDGFVAGSASACAGAA